jgi:hypothetical protein
MDKPRYYFTGDSEKVDLDFSKLDFSYIVCPYRFEAVYEYGVWRVRGLLEDLDGDSEGGQCLHYGQQLFEGMKSATGADGESSRSTPRQRAADERGARSAGLSCREALFAASRRWWRRTSPTSLPLAAVPLFTCDRSTSASATTSASNRPPASCFGSS